MGTPQHVEHGFGPVWNSDSSVLVLGSFPSPKSREQGFYYMHPRNRFWPVMSAIFADDTACPITDDGIGTSPRQLLEARRSFAIRHRIALWDVLESCDIIGASDASIRNPVATDLGSIITRSSIQRIFTTGAKAAALFRSYAKPRLDEQGLDIPMTALPSTSPANAAMRLPALIESYRSIAISIERASAH